MHVSPREVEVIRIRSPVVPEISAVMVVRNIIVVRDIFVYGILCIFFAMILEDCVAIGIARIAEDVIIVNISGRFWRERFVI